MKSTSANCSSRAKALPDYKSYQNNPKTVFWVSSLIASTLLLSSSVFLGFLSSSSSACLIASLAELLYSLHSFSSRFFVSKSGRVLVGSICWIGILVFLLFGAALFLMKTLKSLYPGLICVLMYIVSGLLIASHLHLSSLTLM